MSTPNFVNIFQNLFNHYHPDSKVHGANVGPIWGRHNPGGPNAGPMNLAICDICQLNLVDIFQIWTGHVDTD